MCSSSPVMLMHQIHEQEYGRRTRKDKEQQEGQRATHDKSFPLFLPPISCILISCWEFALFPMGGIKCCGIIPIGALALLLCRSGPRGPIGPICPCTVAQQTKGGTTTVVCELDNNPTDAQQANNEKRYRHFQRPSYHHRGAASHERCLHPLLPHIYSQGTLVKREERSRNLLPGGIGRGGLKFILC